MQGVVEMQLGDGRRLPLAATPGAMLQIEAGELTVEEMLQAHVMGRLKLSEAATILNAGMNAARGIVPGHSDQSSPEACAVLLFENAFATAEAPRRAIGEFLMALLWAPDEVKKKAVKMDWQVFPDYLPLPDEQDQNTT